jgi:glyoxylase-like metal-dependent hydrolase (beta-lactamase superfamily II)/rhodanese-related sulfurtransferase
MMEVLAVDASDVGNRSYLVTDGHKAMAIDPPRPVDKIVEDLKRRGLELTLVVDTHLHNDHVSGGYELAQATGAEYAVGAAEGLPFARGLSDGEVVSVGELSVEVMATPGHTRNHVSYVVREGESSAVFSGGSLLVGTAGRTDLLGAEFAAELAVEQWSSLRKLMAALPEDAVVHPTHGFGSFCAASPAGSATETTIAIERQVNPAALLERDDFVRTMLEGLGEYPTYYAYMADINRAGPTTPYLGHLPPAQRSQDLWIIDVRPRTEFGPCHVPGTINMGIDGQLATYLGWTMPWGTRFGLVGADEEQLDRARRTLAQIGLEPEGVEVFSVPSRPGWMTLATFVDLAGAWSEDIAVVDVRRRDEWDAGHLDGAIHVALHDLPGAIDDLPGDRELWVHCAAGYRAVAAASFLRRAGFEAVAIDDKWQKAGQAGLPVRPTRAARHRPARSQKPAHTRAGAAPLAPLT